MQPQYGDYHNDITVLYDNFFNFMYINPSYPN